MEGAEGRLEKRESGVLEARVRDGGREGRIERLKI